MTLALLRIRFAICDFILHRAGVIYDATVSACRFIERAAGRISQHLDNILMRNRMRLRTQIEIAEQDHDSTPGDIAVSYVIAIALVFIAISFVGDLTDAYGQHLATQFASASGAGK